MSIQAEQSVFLCTIHIKLIERAIHIVLPAQLKEGVEVYAINTDLVLVRMSGMRIPALTASLFGQVSAGIALVLTRTQSVFYTYCPLSLPSMVYMIISPVKPDPCILDIMYAMELERERDYTHYYTTEVHVI